MKDEYRVADLAMDQMLIYVCFDDNVVFLG